MWDVIGKITVACIIGKICFSICKGLYGTFLASVLGFNINLKKMGQWAVVTGATDGIGKAYAFEMARNGLNVVLISRSLIKLQNVAGEIKSKYNVQVKIVDVDFTNLDIYDRIQSELKGLDIGVLVNNVGMNYDHPEYFILNTDNKMVEKMVLCNVLSLSMMTQLILPGMVKQCKGLIINVSSLSSCIPAPFMTIYGSTKAYVSKFSQSLAVEVASKGVTIQCICPGYVVSNMSKIRRASLNFPSAETYVRATMKTTGVESSTAGYFMHKLQIYGIELLQALPGVVMNTIAFDQLNAVRSKALKRKERDAKKE